MVLWLPSVLAVLVLVSPVLVVLRGAAGEEMNSLLKPDILPLILPVVSF